MEFSPVYIIPPALSLVTGLTLAGISVFKGAFKTENVLFSLVCVWLVLLSPVYISHHLISDTSVILIIERSFHVFYVFIVPITIMFFHRVLGIVRPRVEKAAFVASALVAAFVPTRLYMDGLYSFHWGYIAKGGPMLSVFGALGLGATVYGGFICVRRISREENPIIRTKIRYILFSITIVGILTLLNIPAINGVDLYPAGNFMFVPLAIMGFGVLRYRLLDVKSIVHLTVLWAALSSAIVVPNIILFNAIRDKLAGMEDRWVFAVLAAWVPANYFYFRLIQPVINRAFNRQRLDLRKLGVQFVGEIAYLKNIDQLIGEFEEVLSQGLGIKYVDVYLKGGEAGVYGNIRGETVLIDADVEEWFIGANHLAERNMVAGNPYYDAIRERFLALYERFDCVYIVPLVEAGAGTVGLVLMGEKANLRQLSAHEVAFINNIRSAATIAVVNSLMFKNLNDMKENLQRIVEDRTKELSTKNSQMTFELRVAKNVQKLILSPALPSGEHLRVAARVNPLMEVSGDFYDAVELSPRKTALMVIDVSGHGVPSALLTAMIKAEIGALLKRRDVSAGEVANAINRTLSPTLLETDMYFTMFLGIIDTAIMSMEYTNCGHTMPIVIAPDGEVRMLPGSGFMVGASEDTRYESHTVSIEESERLVLYTDGITEARNDDGEFFGEKRLIGVLRETMSLAPSEQLDAVIKAVASFQGNASGRSRDDVTLLIASMGRPMKTETGIRNAVDLFNRRKYERAAEAARPLVPSSLVASQAMAAGRIFAKVGENERALSFIDRALELEPDNSAYRYRRAVLLLSCGRGVDAALEMRRVREIDPAFGDPESVQERIGIPDPN
ncbi:MAG TPA: SpoIIE family protein phosphatase [Spirochaetota bacterium]|nr:SpoIIE family protein phosphatase [Spirochaetota bacterium]HPV98172.1 SpoIIE family protein phosphatase [Spirochaetota bacterium]